MDMPVPKGLVLGVTERVVTTAIKMLAEAGKPDKCGGYFVLLDDKGHLQLVSCIGLNPFEKVRKRVELAWEKCGRLLDNPEDLTSFDTRNPDAERFGGAVRGRTLVFGFSGLPELWDEAAMFVVAIITGELTKDEVLSKISEARNPFLWPLLAACDWVN